MTYKDEYYLVGTLEAKIFLKNKKNIIYTRRKDISLRKNKDKYSLMRLKCKHIVSILNSRTY